MPNNFNFKATVVSAVILLALIFSVPTLGGKLPGWWTSIVPVDEINLGLDLQGGMHLILEVQTDKAVESAVERASQEMRRKAKDENIRMARPKAQPGYQISVVLLSESDKAKFEDMVGNSFYDYEIKKLW